MTTQISSINSHADYDLQSILSESFLNRLFTSAIQAGLINTGFNFHSGGIEELIAFSYDIQSFLNIRNPTLYTETDSPNEIGLNGTFTGEILLTTTFDDWTISGDNNSYTDEGFTTTFSLPFQGEFCVEVQAIIHKDEKLKSQILIASFAQLRQFDLFNIGTLQPGPDLSEFIRRVADRILIQHVRKYIKLPELNGLLLSLPAPLHNLAECRSGQLGSLDLKIVDSKDDHIGDELHVLLQSKVNSGLGNYSLVNSVVEESEQDISFILGYRWLRQIQQDFWAGDIIPRRFNIEGKPDINGDIYIERFQLVFETADIIRIRLFVRKEVAGIPLRFEVSLESRIYTHLNSMKVEIIDIDADLQWAENAAKGNLLIGIYEIIIRMLLRGANQVLSPIADDILSRFLKDLSVNISFQFQIPKTPYTLSLQPLSTSINRNCIIVSYTSKISINSH